MTLAVATLPLTLTNGRTAVTFENDASVGPRIGSVVDDGTLTIEAAADLGAATTEDIDPDEPDGTIRETDGTFWYAIAYQGKTRLEASGKDAVLAQVYTKTLADTSSARVFEYRNVPLLRADTGATTGNTIWVRIAAINPASGDGIRFAAWFGFETGFTARVTELHFPAFMVQEYSGGGGTYVENAYRSRYMFGSSLGGISNEWNHNRNFGMAINRGFIRNQAGGATQGRFAGERMLSHPVPFLQMPYMAIVAADPAVAGTYRRVFMVQCKDQDGLNPYFKRLRYRPVNTGTAAYMKASFALMPRTSAEFGLRDEEAPDGGLRFRERVTGNSGGPTWTLEVQTFASADNNWWYDVVDRYRTQWQASATPTPVRDQSEAWSGKRTGGAAYVGVHATTALRETHEDWQAFERVWPRIAKEYLGLPTLAHRQNVVAESLFGGLIHPNREATNVASHIPETNRILAEQGLLPSIYFILMAKILSPDYDTPDQNLWVSLADETGDGVLRTENPLDTRDFDSFRVIRDRPDFPDQLASIVRNMADRITLKAAYLDVFGAGDQPNLQAMSGDGWGHNNRSDTERRIATAVRQALGEDSAVLAEGVLEGCTWDSGTEVFNLRPFYHLKLEEQYDAALATLSGGTAVTTMTDTPTQMRDGSPPMWQTVHNLESPSFSFTSVADFGNVQGSFLLASGGLTGPQWVDFNSFHWAAAWIVGHKPMSIEDRSNYDLRPLQDEFGTATDADPSGFAGPNLFAFVRNMAQCYGPFAGAWLINGELQRPLVVDYDGATTDLEDNPGTPLRTTLQAPGTPALNILGPSFYPQGVFDVFGFMNAANQVPAVLHTVWKSDIDGSIAMLLVNWTAGTALWEGTFTPTNYGLTAGVAVTHQRFGASVVDAGTISGASFTIRSAASGGDVNLGLLPARSITKVLFSNP